MEVHQADVHGKFEVNFTSKTVIKAIGPLPEPHIITLSNLDLLSGRFPVTYFYFYHRPVLDDFSSIIEALKCSLAKILNHYYPFSGRIAENPNTNEPEIICDNSGALVVEAHANIPLKDLDFHNLNLSLQGKLVSINPEFPFQVQVTNYTCGGISITFTFDHALGDASAFGKFLFSWSEIALRRPLSCIPDHRRNLHARCPPTYDPLLDPYLWKVMVKAIDEKHEKCNMGWLVDGRMSMCGGQNSLSNYIGNVLSVAVGEASVVEVKQGSILDVAKIVHKVISKVTNKAHFLDLIDWIECHRPGLMLSRTVLGRGGPTLVVSSGRRFPVSELDFGFGTPVLGTVCSTIERLGVGYINQRQSARGDGSWTVSAILWPELAAALESDSILQPMTATHLQL
ncbi:Spermidine hydroxycinnamoyl transferase [Vitis vinifera]|uniref:Spermidine hydroxycinnamoyl transferase n=1 Tax=Vitis vinifera TaxID=29760 RepID=A0A438IZD6_VITVI|nr:Spermidine hydroxycinnamoyl transferase [Vitis vinifera]